MAAVGRPEPAVFAPHHDERVEERRRGFDGARELLGMCG
jgi:hypothetical protein